MLNNLKLDQFETLTDEELMEIFGGAGRQNLYPTPKFDPHRIQVLGAFLKGMGSELNLQKLLN